MPQAIRFAGSIVSDASGLVIPIAHELATKFHLNPGMFLHMTLRTGYDPALKTALSDFESLLLQWLEELHDGRDDLETVQVLLGLGAQEFNGALGGLRERGLVTVEGKQLAVTHQGQRVWEQLRGPDFRTEQAAEKLRQLIKAKTNVLVCGGTRQRRRKAIEHAALGFLLRDRLIRPKAAPGIDEELEALGKESDELVVAFYDAQSIPWALFWRIRSVAQSQQNVTYIFEGTGRAMMLDMVTRNDSPFYRQLAIVDLSHRNLSRSPIRTP